jgi:hypothetical protein
MKMPAGANRSGIKMVKHLHFSRKAAWSPDYKVNPAKREIDPKVQNCTPFIWFRNGNFYMCTSFLNHTIFKNLVKSSYFR